MSTERQKRRAAISRAYYSRPENANKTKARRHMSQAIKIGLLIKQPCSKCGSEKVQGHHEDYSRPLEVIWLCRKCHGSEHRKTHCSRGHELKPESVYLHPKRGWRTCHVCQLERGRRYRQSEAGKATKQRELEKRRQNRQPHTGARQ